MAAEHVAYADAAAELAAMNRVAERYTATITPLLPLLPRRVWTMDSWALPVPPLAREYVRDAAEWRAVVHAAINVYKTMPGREYTARLPEYRAFLRSLMFLGPDHDETARRIFRVFPPARCACAGCPNRLIPYSGRVAYCGDDCRRRAAVLDTTPDVATHCATCGATLRATQRRYCSPACQNAPRRAVRPGCAVCGAPVKHANTRCCSRACAATLARRRTAHGR